MPTAVEENAVDTAPLVSIIINNYNYERFLSQAIDSALAQTYPNTEVIVVDDGSSDNSWPIIAGYSDRIIAIAQSNGKQGKAFNTGFASSRGAIIIFLDADDSLFPEAVQTIVDAWKPGIAKVHYRLQVVDADGQPRPFTYPQGGKRLANGTLWPQLLDIATYAGVPTSGNALSREALNAVSPIPEAFKTTADDYLSVSIPFYGDVLAIETPLGAYRIHGSNQWAISEMTSDRLHRFIQHDMTRCALLRQRAAEFGYDVPEDLELRFFGRAWSRLASLKLDPQHHPVPDDQPWPLTYQGIRALWRFPDFRLPRKLALTLWFLWVGLLPGALARPIINWLLNPVSRPQVMLWTVRRLRTLAG